MSYLPPTEPFPAPTPAAAPGARDVPGPGERTAWLVPTAVLGGLGALLLLGAGGAVAATALSVEERRVDTSVTEPVDSVVVDAQAARVQVRTADVTDIRVLAVYHGIGLQAVPDPRVVDRRLLLELPHQGPWPGPGAGLDVTVTVPVDHDPVDVRVRADAGQLVTDGEFGDLDLSMGAGLVEVAGSARSLAVTSELGAVDIDGARVREDLDVHTEVGALEVRITGDAPRRSSVTTASGSVEAALPPANYWRPPLAGGAGTDPGGPSAAAVCAEAPKDRPCLYVSSGTGAADLRYGARSGAVDSR